MNVAPLQLHVMNSSHNNSTLVAASINISFFNLGITLGSYFGKITGSYIGIPATDAITGAIIILSSALIAWYIWKRDDAIKQTKPL